MTYRKDGVTYTREAFASAPDEVVLLVAAAANSQGFAGRGTADPLTAISEQCVS